MRVNKHAPAPEPPFTANDIKAMIPDRLKRYDLGEPVYDLRQANILAAYYRALWQETHEAFMNATARYLELKHAEKPNQPEASQTAQTKTGI